MRLRAACLPTRLFCPWPIGLLSGIRTVDLSRPVRAMGAVIAVIATVPVIMTVPVVVAGSVVAVAHAWTAIVDDCAADIRTAAVIGAVWPVTVIIVIAGIRDAARQGQPGKADDGKDDQESETHHPVRLTSNCGRLVAAAVRAEVLVRPWGDNGRFSPDRNRRGGPSGRIPPLSRRPRPRSPRSRPRRRPRFRSSADR